MPAASKAVADRVGRTALALLVLAGAALALTHLGGLRWDSDEGINVSKAWLLADGFGLYREVWADQPPGYTWLLGQVFRVLGPSLTAARGLTVLASLPGAVGVAIGARALLAERGAGPGTAWAGGLAGALALLLAPNHWWASRAAMIGLPAFAWAALALGLALGYARSGSPLRLGAAALALGLSLWFKLQLLYLGLPLGLLVVWRRLARADEAGRARLPRLARDLILLGAGSLGPLAISALAYGPQRFYQQVLGTYLDTRSSYTVDLGANLALLGTWLASDNLGLLLLALAGALVLLRHPSAGALLALAWPVLAILTALQHAPLWIKDHFEPLLFGLALLAGVAFGELLVLARRRGDGPAGPSWPGWLALAGLLAWLAWLPRVLAVDASLAQARSYRNDGRIAPPDSGEAAAEQRRDDELRAAASFLAAYSRPEDFVITDYQLVAFLAGRRLAPEMAAFSSRAVGVGAFSDAGLIAATESHRVPVVLMWDAEIADFDAYGDFLRAPVEDRPRFSPIIDLGNQRQGWVRGSRLAEAPPDLADFEGLARLLGYVLDPVPGPDGTEALDLRLFWHSQGRSAEQLSVFTHLYAADGERYGQHDGTPAEGGQPTTEWPLQALIIDRHRIEIAADAPDDLRVHLGFYAPDSGARVPLHLAGQRIAGDALVLPDRIDPRGDRR